MTPHNAPYAHFVPSQAILNAVIDPVRGTHASKGQEEGSGVCKGRPNGRYFERHVPILLKRVVSLFRYQDLTKDGVTLATTEHTEPIRGPDCKGGRGEEEGRGPAARDDDMVGETHKG